MKSRTKRVVLRFKRPTPIWITPTKKLMVTTLGLIPFDGLPAFGYRRISIGGRSADVRQICPERKLTLNLFRASEEANGPKDVRRALRKIGLKPTVARQNPTTHDVWILGLEFISRHGTEIGAALATLLVSWLKQKSGRHIEIQRHGLKLKVATVRDLEQTLKVLKKYDDLEILLRKAKSAPRRARGKVGPSKKVAGTRSSKKKTKG